jgi:hypothetical protein
LVLGPAARVYVQRRHWIVTVPPRFCGHVWQVPITSTSTSRLPFSGFQPSGSTRNPWSHQPCKKGETRVVAGSMLCLSCETGLLEITKMLCLPPTTTTHTTYMVVETCSCRSALPNLRDLLACLRLTPAVCRCASAKLALYRKERESNLLQTKRWFQQLRDHPAVGSRDREEGERGGLQA